MCSNTILGGTFFIKIGPFLFLFIFVFSIQFFQIKLIVNNIVDDWIRTSDATTTALKVLLHNFITESYVFIGLCS